MSILSGLDVFTILSNTNFRNLWFAQILSQLAINMMAFILAIRVYQETLSNTATSITFLAIGLPALIFGVPAGVFADHSDKKRILTGANITRAVFMLSLFIFFRDVTIIYLLAFAISSISQFFVPAEGSLLAELVNKDDLLSANSLFSLSYYSSVAFGFILSGPAIRVFGMPWVFLFLSLLMFLAGYFTIRLPKQKRGDFIVWINFMGKVRKLASNVGQSFLFISKRPYILSTLLFITITQVVATVFSALVPGFADQVLHIRVEDASYLVLGPTIAGIVVGSMLPALLGKNKLEHKVFIASTLVFSGLLVVFLTRTPFLITIAFLFLLGIAQALLLVPSYTTLQKNVSGEFRGRVYGVLASFIGGASIIPAVAAGFLADHIGVVATIQSLGVLVGAIGLFVLLYI